MNILIVNPKAGYGKAQKLFERLKKDPLYKQKNCRAFFTEYAGHAEKIAEQVVEIHHESLACIFVLGGDGTLHEVINGTKKRPSIPIAFVPAGSGNDFARGIGTRKKGVELFRKMITHPKIVHLHQGVFVPNQRYQRGSRYFANSIGFGLDGKIVSAANRPVFRKWMQRLYLQKFIYTLALLRLLKNYEPITVELQIDEKTMQFANAAMVTVTNHPYYGGGMKITPKMHIQHPGFHVLVIDSISKWKILGLFLTVFFGTHTKLKEVSVREAHTVKVSSEQPLPYQIDGQSGECMESDIKKSGTKRTFYSA
ncbi:diacylglycerol kinase family protein [Halobacillus sp. BBL2006]|uniref:diacylglycerol/lipid kinase family protein n=1 Tax=Halobacillus sp. BBL2006 TaxID=1543706 RepID=UPI00068C4053|nr:diacylglycerol kinase family protein [Halobacillus sp. BBL2006]